MALLTIPAYKQPCGALCLEVHRNGKEYGATCVFTMCYFFDIVLSSISADFKIMEWCSLNLYRSVIGILTIGEDKFHTVVMWYRLPPDLQSNNQ